MEFECAGSPYDTFDEVLEEYGPEEAAERFLKDECGATIKAPGKTGMGHLGVVAADFWCDECGKHYTAAEARAIARKQKYAESND